MANCLFHPIVCLEDNCKNRHVIESEIDSSSSEPTWNEAKQRSDEREEKSQHRQERNRLSPPVEMQVEWKGNTSTTLSWQSQEIIRDIRKSWDVSSFFDWRASHKCHGASLHAAACLILGSEMHSLILSLSRNRSRMEYCRFHVRWLLPQLWYVLEVFPAALSLDKSTSVSWRIDCTYIKCHVHKPLWWSCIWQKQKMDS